MSSRSRSRPLKRFKQRCWECTGVYIRSKDSAFDFGFCISVECRCSLYRKLDRRQHLLNGRHGRTHVFRKPVMNTQEPHHGLPQSARCQTSHANTEDETLLEIKRCNKSRLKAENINAGSLHLIKEEGRWLLKTELNSSDSEKEMIKQEEEQKAIERQVRMAYAKAHRVVPKARPRKGSQT